MRWVLRNTTLSFNTLHDSLRQKRRCAVESLSSLNCDHSVHLPLYYLTERYAKNTSPPTSSPLKSRKSTNIKRHAYPTTSPSPPSWFTSMDYPALRPSALAVLDSPASFLSQADSDKIAFKVYWTRRTTFRKGGMSDRIHRVRQCSPRYAAFLDLASEKRSNEHLFFLPHIFVM